jgi:hypothetical protein
MAIVNGAMEERPSEPLTWTVKANVPVADGVPERMPVELNARPEGRVPDVTNQL